MENKVIVLPSKEYQGAPNKDLNLIVKLDSDEVLLREGDMDISLDVLLAQYFSYSFRYSSVSYKESV